MARIAVVITIRTAVPTICTGEATPDAIRSGIMIAENGGIQLSVLARVLSGSLREEVAAKNMARIKISSGMVVELTSSCRETIDPPAA